MGRCSLCHKESRLISQILGICLDCIRTNFPKASPYLEKAHLQARSAFNLPVTPPRSHSKLSCRFCSNQCEIPEGERGFCGIRMNREGKLIGGNYREGYISWYFDPLPTNCVADWVCPGGTGAGYPRFSHSKGPEISYKNLAVFYQGCSFDCLFCQNWHFREMLNKRKPLTALQLASKVDARTSCICYFGGDPTPQLPHAIMASRLALSKNSERILRICWETNGSMNARLLKKMTELSLKSGGCIKFDLKAWSLEIHLALCGVSNERTLENFSWIAGLTRQRPEPPLLVASTLLVPGYVDTKEVTGIAQFIASLNQEIPYSLLAFHPQFYMGDLPTTSKEHALRCKEVAEKAGLKRVKIGNLHLLQEERY